MTVTLYTTIYLLKKEVETKLKDFLTFVNVLEKFFVNIRLQEWETWSDRVNVRKMKFKNLKDAVLI